MKPRKVSVMEELVSAMSSLNMPNPRKCSAESVEHAYEHLVVAVEMINDHDIGLKSTWVCFGCHKTITTERIFPGAAIFTYPENWKLLKTENAYGHFCEECLKKLKEEESKECAHSKEHVVRVSMDGDFDLCTKCGKVYGEDCGVHTHDQWAHPFDVEGWRHGDELEETFAHRYLRYKESEECKHKEPIQINFACIRKSCVVFSDDFLSKGVEAMTLAPERYRGWKVNETYKEEYLCAYNELKNQLENFEYMPATEETKQQMNALIESTFQAWEEKNLIYNR